MVDLEKVIKGLGKCKRYECNDCTEKGASQAPWDCPVYDDFVDSAIVLLKEQEAVEPEVEVLNEIDRLYRCPKCHKCFFYEKQKYCDQCGQAVKWE